MFPPLISDESESPTIYFLQFLYFSGTRDIPLSKIGLYGLPRYEISSFLPVAY